MNTDLLRKIADQIEANPELYDQRYFSCNVECGTAYCVAGWAIAIARPELLNKYGKTPGGVSEEGTKLANAKLASILRHSTSYIAMGELGLTPEEALRLFDDSTGPLTDDNVPDALRRIADMGTVPSWVWGEQDGQEDCAEDQGNT